MIFVLLPLAVKLNSCYLTSASNSSFLTLGKDNLVLFCLICNR